MYAPRAIRYPLLILLPVMISACDRSPSKPEPAPTNTASDDSVKASAATSPAGTVVEPHEMSIPAPDSIEGIPDRLRNRLNEVYGEMEGGVPNDASLFNLGRLYLANRLVAQARICFSHLVKSSPNVMRNWYYLGLASERLGENDAALTAYQHALKLNDAYVPLILRMAMLEMDSAPESARPRFVRALELLPENPIGYYGLGRCDEAAGKAEAARIAYQTAIERFPGYKAAHEAMARLAAASGHDEAAARHASVAAAGGPPPSPPNPLEEDLLRLGMDIPTEVRQAQALISEGRLDSAGRLLAQVLMRQPDNIDARNGIALVLAKQGRFSEAARQFFHVLEIEPDDYVATSNIAQALTDLGDLTLAEIHFNKAIELRPDDTAVRRRYASMLLAADRPDDAVRVLKPDLQQDGEYAAMTAVALLYAGNAEKAAADVAAGVKDLEFVAQLLGVMEMRRERSLTPLDDSDQRIVRFAKSLRDAGRDELAALFTRFAESGGQGFEHEILARAGYAELKAGRFAAAAKLLERAIAADPESTFSRNLLGFARLQSGDFQGAMEQFSKVLELTPQDDKARSNLGQAFFGLKNYASAEALFRDVLKRLPDDPATLERLGLLLIMTSRFDESVAIMEQLAATDVTANPAMLSSVALAYAMAGRADDAARTQRQLRDSAAANMERLTLPRRLAGILSEEQGPRLTDPQLRALAESLTNVGLSDEADAITALIAE